MNLLLTKAVLLVLLVLSLFLLFIKIYTNGHHIDKISDKNLTLSKIEQKQKKELDLKSILRECNKTLDKRYKTVASEIEDYMRALEIVKKEEEYIKEINISKKIKPVNIKKSKQIATTTKSQSRLPKIVIIMDDICSKLQAHMLKEIPLKITPSIFPSTCDHPDTPKIAKLFRSFMVHTPMQAYHYSSPEIDTLNTDDSIKVIEKRIKKIKDDFPNLSAINNHTGSMFTSDEKSMKNLFSILKKYDINFVDSRTSAQTKAAQTAKEYGMNIYERNIFLDNIDDVDEILKKIKESIDYAKAHRLAIAICHPRENTFKALIEAKNLFKGVEVVYIDELYR